MNILLENVGFSYKSKAFVPFRVFDRLNLSLCSGECVAIIGEESTGKSTLLQLCNGLQKPDEGSVVLNGIDLWQDSKSLLAVRKKTGFAFQFPEQQFFCENVRDELLFSSRNFGLLGDDAEELCVTALKRLGLDEGFLSRSPFSLSMGEARRVALASLLIHQPDLYFLDEPTAGLDGFGIAIVESLLQELKSEGKTILFATHELGLVSSVATRVVTLADRGVGSDVRVTVTGQAER